MSLLSSITRNPDAPADAGAAVPEVDLNSFVTEVIEGSRDRIVIVDFWSARSPQSKQFGPLLEKAVRGAKGVARPLLGAPMRRRALRLNSDAPQRRERAPTDLPRTIKSDHAPRVRAHPRPKTQCRDHRLAPSAPNARGELSFCSPASIWPR